ncbi:hypothetical protein ACTMTU_35170 [Streptomyces sp. OZ13]|uniref:hypothetical protein n=1 Tax=Streptomyces sp. OZ13 TaxID=3452210 RepID=UPI003F8A32CD
MTRLHVMNRSPDPLTCTHVAFRAVNLAPDGHQVTDAAEFDAEMLSIAPCTEVIYSTDRMRISGERSDDRDERFDFRRMEISNIAIVFVDRDGVRWMRNVGGLKPIGWKTRPAIPRLSGTPTIHLTDGLPSVKRIAECGSTY